MLLRQYVYRILVNKQLGISCIMIALRDFLICLTLAEEMPMHQCLLLRAIMRGI